MVSSMPANRTCRLALAALLLLVLAQAPRAATAAESVYFDVPRTIAFRDVTTEEFRASYPHERIMEGRFPVSSLIRAAEGDLIQFLYRIDFRDQGSEVIDYLPKTTLTSNVVGNVGIERKSEESRTLGLAVTGSFDHLVTGTGTGNVASKDLTSIQYDLLPPMEMVSASGTLERRAGVYFKLKPTQQSSLEGGKEFIVVIRVPQSWRGDYARVQCQAFGYRRSPTPPFEERAVLGQADFQVGIYAEGDEVARHVAAEFARSETQLRNASSVFSRQIHRRSFPTVAHRVGAMFDVVSPQIPANWLEQLVRGESLEQNFSDNLPPEVREAAEQYLVAKRQIIDLAQ
jgi:hypothetical protein